MDVKKQSHIKLYLFIIFASSLIAHFLFFGQPRETVFDEVHFGKFISGYFTHEYFFDIHPPLGKLMISGVGYITGFEPGFSFAEIGQGFPDNAFLWLRLLPVLAGTLLPAIIFLLAIRLGLSSLASLAAGLFVVLENALLTQSRFMLLDPLLLLFGFSALLFYFIYETRSHDAKFLLPAGILAAMAVSVKWTGGTFWAIIMIVEVFKTVTNRWMVKNWTHYLISRAAFLIVIPGVIYFSIFALHFALLTKSGPGDAFMTPEFRKTLIGSADSINADLQPLNILQKFKELNFQMYKSNATLTATHPYSSKWYAWPLMIRPIYYWNGSAPPTGPGQASSPQVQSRIYLLGNPAVWWASTLAVFYLAVTALALILKALKNKTVLILWRANNLPVFLLGSWIINLLPFVGISRAMFSYHYFPALIFAIISLAYLVGQLSPKNQKRAFVALITASVAAFIFFAPLTYGLPLSEKMYNARVWLKTWR